MEHKNYDFGLVGLGVMGRNFILNVADNDFKAFGYDLDQEKVDALKEEGGDLNMLGLDDFGDDFVDEELLGLDDYVEAGSMNFAYGW